MTNWDKTLPSGAISIRLGDDKIRDNNAALEEALSVEHNFPDNSGGSRRGRHKFGVGTQGARNAAIGTPATGEVWYDTTYYQWSVYDGTAWRGLGARVGDIKMSGVPIVVDADGWLGCKGQTVSKTTYAALFAAIGTTFNIGGEAGSDFRLPNLNGRSPVGQTIGGDPDGDYGAIGGTYGEKTHTLTVAEMPSHSHSGSASSNLAGSATFMTDGGTAGTFGSGGQGARVSTSHSHSISIGSQGGGQDHENRPPLIVLGFLIYSGV